MWGAEHGASVLQWSHALTRVETEARREEGIPRDDASMEPRTHARGNRSRQGCAHSVAHRFNGATHSRAWKHQLPARGKGTKLASMEPRTHARGNEPFSDLIPSQRYCFNGATHSRAWKRARSAMTSRRVSSLQWSHALTRVETRPLLTPR